MLTRREKNVLRLAAELVETGKEMYSCHAINVADSGSFINYCALTAKYVKFYELTSEQKGVGIGPDHDIPGRPDKEYQNIRILMLLNFAEAG